MCSVLAASFPVAFHLLIASVLLSGKSHFEDYIVKNGIALDSSYGGESHLMAALFCSVWAPCGIRSARQPSASKHTYEGTSMGIVAIGYRAFKAFCSLQLQLDSIPWWRL